MAYVQHRNPIPKTGCGRRRVERVSAFPKKVPNCIPKGKLKKESGDPCWKNYVQRGMKEM